MTERTKALLFDLFLFLAGLISCQPLNTGEITSVKPTLPSSVSLLIEREIQEIPLVGPASQSRAEISGMDWCGEDLVLLPQYPGGYVGDGEASVFVIPQDILQDYFSGGLKDGITPGQIPFDTGGIEKSLSGFEGFESIIFNDTDFYVSIEARQGDGMMGYLMKGAVGSDCSELVLDPDSVVSLPPQAEIENMSHETLFIFEDKLYAIYEANGMNVNPDPVAKVFDFSLNLDNAVAMPNIEYRITDATQPDEDGEFWAVNYFFPGEADELAPAVDRIALEYGIGASHQGADPVERLIKFRIDNDEVVLVDRQPIYMKLGEDDSRNWEGIVRYRDGFLLVTDRFPTTIFAYVALAPTH